MRLRVTRLTAIASAVQQLITSYNPGVLFANNEQGVWYDPPDMSTLFQDSIGATPVTAVEQPVGLMLDKSKGLVLGPEQVVAPYSGSSTGVFSIVENSVVRAGGGGGGTVSLNTNQAFKSGSVYKVTLFVSNFSGDLSIFRLGASGGAFTSISSNGQKTFFVSASGNTAVLYFAGISTGAGTITISDISVRELPGNHATQVFPINRPVLSARVNLLTKTEEFDDAVWTKTNTAINANTVATLDPLGGNTADLLRPTSTGFNRFIFQQALPINLQFIRSVYAKAAGKSVFYIDPEGNGSKQAFFDLSVGAVGPVSFGYTSAIEPAGNGWFKCSISTLPGPTPTSFGGVYGAADAIGSTQVTVNGNDGIYIWGADLRVANDGVNLPPYQRVNTATDYDSTGFPVYLRADGVDDGMVTNSIDFTATDKMTVVAGVRQLGASGTIGILAEMGNYGAGTFTFHVPFDVAIDFTSRGSGVSQTKSAYSSPTTNVLTGIGNISGDSAILRVNAIQAAISTADQGTGNFGNYPLYLFRRGGTTLPFNGRFYGMTIVNKLLSTAELEQLETYTNGKTRAYVPPTPSYLLLENSDKLLLEDGSLILLEA